MRAPDHATKPMESDATRRPAGWSEARAPPVTLAGWALFSLETRPISKRNNEKQFVLAKFGERRFKYANERPPWPSMLQFRRNLAVCRNIKLFMGATAIICRSRRRDLSPKNQKIFRPIVCPARPSNRMTHAGDLPEPEVTCYCLSRSSFFKNREQLIPTISGRAAARKVWEREQKERAAMEKFIPIPVGS